MWISAPAEIASEAGSDTASGPTPDGSIVTSIAPAALSAGIAPADAVPLAVSGVSPDEARAWRLGDHIYLRTSYTLMSPPWDGSQSGEGNTTIYALPITPVVLLSVNNRTVSAELKEER